MTGRPGRVEEGMELGEGNLERELKNGRRNREESLEIGVTVQMSQSK